MHTTSQRVLQSGGGAIALESPVYRPERQADITQALLKHPGALVVRGGGTAYGDCAMEEEGVLSTERLNRFIHFDPAVGRIRVEAGVTAGDVMRAVVPHGWRLAVVPDDPLATIGGCVAANTHGLNQYRAGEMVNCVTDLTLQLPTGRVVHCSPQLDPDIFRATVGGMGMTGYIRDITLQLALLPSRTVQEHHFRVPDIEHMVAVFREYRPYADYMQAWLDQSAPLRQLGRGVFRWAVHLDTQSGGLPHDREIKAPEYTEQKPSFARVLTHPRIRRTLQRRRFAGAKDTDQQQDQDILAYCFPRKPRAVRAMRARGKGVARFHCFIPDGPEVELQIHRLLHMTYEQGNFALDAQLYQLSERMSGANDNYARQYALDALLRFAGDGFGLRMDFAYSNATRLLLKEMTGFVERIGGRIYLASDTVMDTDDLEQMYGNALPDWWRILALTNPRGRMSSQLALRLAERRAYP